MHRSKHFWVAVALGAAVAVPVWAQSQQSPSDDSNGDGQHAMSMGDSQTNGGQAGGQNGGQMQQQPPQPANGPQGAPQPGMPPQGRPAPPPPGGHPPPPPSSGPQAAGFPLTHVCLSQSKAYSPGAVVKMNQKPYRCKASSGDTSGVLHWVAVSDDS